MSTPITLSELRERGMDDDMRRVIGLLVGDVLPQRVNGKDELCAEEGHLFEVSGEPPYKCTFCGIRHDMCEGGVFFPSKSK